MPKGTTTQTSINLRVKRPEDMQNVIDQIHTFTKRLAAGSGVTITVISDIQPTQKDTSEDENALL